MDVWITWKMSAFSIKDAYTIPSMHLRHIRTTVHLFPYGEASPHLQHNPYLRSGYRSYLSARQCVNSIFVMSNEFVNIWSHLLMAIYWMFLLVYDQTITLPASDSTVLDHLVHLTYFLCVHTSMILSVGFHTFSGHTLEYVYKKWYAADLVGILVAILGCYIPGLYYAFYCRPEPQYLYLGVLAAFMFMSVVFMCHRNYLSCSWNWKRKCHLLLLTIFGIVPTIHWSVISEATEVQQFLPKVIILYGILGCAFFFYTSRVPESCLPGKFDIIGHSHNIWHILVALSLLYWRNATIQLMVYRYNHQCANDLTETWHQKMQILFPFYRSLFMHSALFIIFI